jgi:hypothetical protein
MRRFQALLLTAGLAAAPASAVAGPSDDNSSSNSQTFERFTWSMNKGRLGVMVSPLDEPAWLRKLREWFQPANPGQATLHS